MSFRAIAVCLSGEFFLIAAPLMALAAEQPVANAKQQFDDHIASLIARRCLSCHSGAEPKGELDLSSSKSALAGGESGPVIVPGDPEKSLLWEHVRDEEMPPKKPLPAAEKERLKAWIAGGARWGSDPIDVFRFTTGTRAGYDWWSLQPIRRPAMPMVKNSSGVRNPIDVFVRARLDEKGLWPSPPADRRALARRLNFDLVGLPPTPEEVDAFVADKSPQAEKRLVDRLLASPHYGERWARHWLDIVRFGESQGFERDKLRNNSWPYRDWVVEAFNRDLPYDQFARLQLAGDVLRPSDPAAVIATGFLVAGPYDEVGQTQQSAAMRAIVRQDELEDIASAVGQTFLGLTINCARCHDHKFDPVRQEEYYRFTAALAGVRHGERKTPPKRIANQAALEKQLTAARKRLADVDQAARAKILAKRKETPKDKRPVPKALAQWEFDGDLKDSLGALDAATRGKATVSAGALRVDGKTSYAATVPLKRDLREKTLEAWVMLDNLTQRGGAAISVQTTNGAVFDAIVFGEREPGRWMFRSNGFVRTRPLGGPPETEADKRPVHVAIVYAGDGTITAYRNGQPYGKPYRAGGPITYKAGGTQVVFGLRHSPVGGNKMLAGAIHRARLYDRALSADEVAASAGVESSYVPESEILALLTPEQRSERAGLQNQIARITKQLASRTGRTVYAVVPRKPEPTHLLARGNPAAKGKLLTAGGVAALRGVEADFKLPANAPDAQRRIKLAKWIASRDNPLFARVIVNRLWHYHFGVGLIDTPSDFGFNGGRVTHPELLDWLAAELIESGWSLKHLHRVIVGSATYRQSSRHIASAAKIDAGNRLLWRKSPRRLEAEAVRDTVLSVAGQLNPAVGGPPYRDFTTFTANSQFYNMIDPVGPRFNRRSLYRTWVRSGRSGFLDAFDCPDPSTKSPKRAVTTTPLQALSLLNNSFVLRMCDRLAERLRREAGEDMADQIRLAYRLAYGRRAEKDEVKLTRAFVAEHGLPALCRVIFNSNEFLYVE